MIVNYLSASFVLNFASFCYNFKGFYYLKSLKACILFKKKTKRLNKIV